MERSSHARWTISLAVLLPLILAACQPLQSPAGKAPVDTAPAVVNGPVKAAWSLPLSESVTVLDEEMRHPDGLTYDAVSNLDGVKAVTSSGRALTPAICPDLGSLICPVPRGTPIAPR